MSNDSLWTPFWWVFEPFWNIIVVVIFPFVVLIYYFLECLSQALIAALFPLEWQRAIFQYCRYIYYNNKICLIDVEIVDEQVVRKTRNQQSLCGGYFICIIFYNKIFYEVPSWKYTSFLNYIVVCISIIFVLYIIDYIRVMISNSYSSLMEVDTKGMLCPIWLPFVILFVILPYKLLRYVSDVGINKVNQLQEQVNGLVGG